MLDDRGLRPGAWIELREAGEPVRGKLIAIIASTDTYVFVDRTGRKLREWSQQGLAGALSQGQVRLLDATQLATALLGDAIALGPHWIYDPSDITRRFGVITGPVQPPPDLYHPTKKAGDQTHLGDQVVTLNASIDACGFRFDPEDFSSRWEAMWTGYGDYFDKATKVTLAARQAGTPWTMAGAPSEELGGARFEVTLPPGI